MGITIKIIVHTVEKLAMVQYILANKKAGLLGTGYKVDGQKS